MYWPKKSNRGRNWDDPAYVQFRKDVLKRDKHKCKMCESSSKLQVHHIIKWTNAYALRYEVSNGITLCRTCHDSIKGKEEHYINYFYELINDNGKGKNKKD